MVLLTNRVNPTRANEKIRQVRPAVHDAIFQALGLLNRQQSLNNFLGTKPARIHLRPKRQHAICIIE